MNDSAFALQWDATPQESLIEILVREHYASVFRFLAFALAKEDLAAKAACEVFATAVAKRKEYRDKPYVPPRVWLLAVAARAVRSRPKLRAESGGAVQASQGWLENHISTWFDSLERHLRTAVFLHYAEHLESGEIAYILGWRTAVVSERLEAARMSLFKTLEPSLKIPGERETPESRLEDQIQRTLAARWELPDFSPHEIHEVLDSIAAETQVPPPKIRRSSLSTEILQTTLLISVIVILVLLINPDRHFRRGDPLFPTPTAIPPTPYLQETTAMAASSRVLAETGRWPFVRIFEPYSFPISTVEFLPDGTILAAGRANFGINLCSAKGGHQFFLLEDFNPSVEQVALAPDRNVLATGTFNGVVILWDATAPAGKERIFVLPGHPGPISDLAFSPGGQHLAVGSDGGTWLWEIGEDAKRTIVYPGEQVVEIAFSPDGKVLATAEGDGAVWFRTVPEGQVLWRIGGQERVSAIAFSPDDRLVAFGAIGRVEIWALALGPTQTGGTRHVQSLSVSGRVRDLAFAPDSRELAIITTGDGLLLWDVHQAGLLQAPFHIKDTVFTEVVFSPDEDRLAIGSGQGAMYVLQKELDESPSDGASRFFLPMDTQQITREAVESIEPDCGKAGWEAELLQRPILQFSETQAQISPSFSPATGAMLVSEEQTSRSTMKLVYRIYEDPTQIILLNVHQPTLIDGLIASIPGFQDEKIGLGAQIERLQISGVHMEFVRGGWAFQITDEPVFQFQDVQIEDVGWLAAWEPEILQQRIRWKTAGRLFEILHFAKSGSASADTEAFMGKTELIERILPIVLSSLSAQKFP